MYHVTSVMQPGNSSQTTGSYVVALPDSVRTGALSGLVAAWAIFGMILAVGGQLGLPPGTFYQMVGVSLGIDSEWPAVYLGFLLHMITGTTIGIIYMIISDRVSVLRTNSTPKTFATGVATGIAVWAVLFVPLHIFLVQPTLQNEVSILPAGSPAYLVVERLVVMSDAILYGALAIHIAFGGVLGFIARVATSSR